MSIFKRKKIELSPRLKLGIGRSSQNRVLKYSAIICLVLAGILAINAFRLIFSSAGNLSSSIDPNAQVLGATDVKTQADNPTQQPQVINYKVAEGDTLFSISQQFNISWTTLATLNNLKSPFTLKLGQTLKIPK
jgi:LysM repeat protein